MKREPVAIIDAVKTVVELAIIWAVIMQIWPMSPEQQAITVSFFIAIVEAAGVFLKRSRVTPLNSPRDAQNYPLVREDWQ